MRCWDRVVPLLADRFRIVLVDLPGFGGSGGGGRGATIEDLAAPLPGVLDGAAVVAGHSLGGAVAVALAERAPSLVERLVLVNAPPTFESRLTARKGPEGIIRTPVVGRLAWRAANEDRVRAGLATAFAPGFDVPDEFVEDMRATSWGAFTGATGALDDYLSAGDLGKRVATRSVPVTVVFGDQDQRVDPASLSVFDAADNATVAHIPEAGHTPVWETPERVADLIAAG
jgi:pimeloyl-ACP methyl ester carboxylesterase